MIDGLNELLALTAEERARFVAVRHTAETDVDRLLTEERANVESCVLGLTVAVFVAIIGVPLRWATAIGLATGASNVVPYMGFAAALLRGSRMRCWPRTSIRCFRS